MFVVVVSVSAFCSLSCSVSSPTRRSPDLILASDLARAATTAESLRRAVGVPIEYEPLLHERNFGDVRGTPYADLDRKSTRLNSSHLGISYAVFCLKTKTRRRT